MPACAFIVNTHYNSEQEFYFETLRVFSVALNQSPFHRQSTQSTNLASRRMGIEAPIMNRSRFNSWNLLVMVRKVLLVEFKAKLLPVL